MNSRTVHFWEWLLLWTQLQVLRFQTIYLWDEVRYEDRGRNQKELEGEDVQDIDNGKYSKNN